MRASPMADRSVYADLMGEVRACKVCAAHLPLGPRPVLRGLPSARLLVVSQAPGTRVHETGLSFNDRSGDRLRHWLGIDRDTFYDESRVAVLPMGMCYPGRFPQGGDRPPPQAEHDRDCAGVARLYAEMLPPAAPKLAYDGLGETQWVVRRRGLARAAPPGGGAGPGIARVSIPFES